MKDETKEKEKRETPIRDGDTRPDQGTSSSSHPGSQVVKRTKGERKRTTKERGADVNSLEDFRDAN